MAKMKWAKIGLCTLLISVVLTGYGGLCSKKKDKDTTSGSSSPVRTIVKDGYIVLPPGTPLSITDLTVKTGVVSANPSPDGTFQLDLPNDCAYLLFATDQNNKPILMSVVTRYGTITTSGAINKFVLSTETTAMALLYCTPGIASNNTSQGEQNLNIIKGLSQVSELSTILSTRLSQDPYILTKDDLEIRLKLEQAITSYGNQKSLQ